MSSVAGQQSEHMQIAISRQGSWRTSAVLTNGDPPTGRVSVILEDLELIGTVERSGLDATARPSVVATGAPGWDLPLARPLSYQSDAGVRLSTVLTDLSSLAGQSIEQPADTDIGAHYTAVQSTGRTTLLRDVLTALQGHVAPWRVDPDGVTRFGLRTGSEVSARATILRRNAALGMTRYGIDSPAAFMPGNTIDGEVIDRVIFHEQSAGLEVEVWTRPTPSILDSVLRMVAEVFPALVYGYPRTYVVANVRADKRLDLVPPADAAHLPELDAVEQWGLGLVTPAPGTEITVVFRDANPARPVAMPLEFNANPVDYEMSTTNTTELNATTQLTTDAALIKLGAGASLGSARLTDPVLVTLPATIITGTIVAPPFIPAPIPPALPTACTITVTGWAPATAPGTITGASTKVLVE